MSTISIMDTNRTRYIVTLTGKVSTSRQKLAAFFKEHSGELLEDPNTSNGITEANDVVVLMPAETAENLRNSDPDYIDALPTPGGELAICLANELDYRPGLYGELTM